MIVLGIESSCDETAVALITSNRAVLAAEILSQITEHQPYGGVVPEIAARAHLAFLPAMIERVMAKAGIDFADVDGIAATAGPGLVGGLIVGAAMAKALAFANNKPYLAVNHLEAHALSPRLMEYLPFPYLLLLVSGGHTQILVVEDVGRYRLLGTTIDDAAGECFDKVAKLLGLPYPGGPEIEKLAQEGDAAAYKFPRPMKGEAHLDFSFSGLKTAVRSAVVNQTLSDQQKKDVAASFQQAVVESLADRLARALTQTSLKTCVVAGGVAANNAIRTAIENICAQAGAKLIVPPAWLCTDNAHMVAWAGIERLERGLASPLEADVRPRWPLMEVSYV